MQFENSILINGKNSFTNQTSQLVYSKDYRI